MAGGVEIMKGKFQEQKVAELVNIGRLNIHITTDLITSQKTTVVIPMANRKVCCFQESVLGVPVTWWCFMFFRDFRGFLRP